MHPRCCRPATGRQHRGCIIPQAVTHSLVLLKMGRIIARNMLSWRELLINGYYCIKLVVYIIYISLYIFGDLLNNLHLFPNKMSCISWRYLFSVRKIFIFYVNDVLLFKYPVPGPKGYLKQWHQWKLIVKFWHLYYQWCGNGVDVGAGISSISYKAVWSQLYYCFPGTKWPTSCITFKNKGWNFLPAFNQHDHHTMCLVTGHPTNGTSEIKCKFCRFFFCWKNVLLTRNEYCV